MGNLLPRVAAESALGAFFLKQRETALLELWLTWVGRDVAFLQSSGKLERSPIRSFASYRRFLPCCKKARPLWASGHPNPHTKKRKSREWPAQHACLCHVTCLDGVVLGVSSMWLVHYKPHMGHELMGGKDSSRARAGWSPPPTPIPVMWVASA